MLKLSHMHRAKSWEKTREDEISVPGFDDG